MHSSTASNLEINQCREATADLYVSNERCGGARMGRASVYLLELHRDPVADC